MQVVPIPRSLWLSRDWMKIRSLARCDRPAQEAREPVARLRLGGGQRFVDRVDRHLRGDLAGRRAAHAVADQQQRALVAQLEGERGARLGRHARRAVTSATRKLSSLCSRTSPTSVLPKTSIAMSGGVGHRAAGRLYPISNRRSSSPNRIRSPEIEPMRPAETQEGAVRAAQVLQMPAPVAERDLRVPARHEFVVGKDRCPPSPGRAPRPGGSGGRCPG